MELRVYNSEEEWTNMTRNHLVRFTENDGTGSCARFPCAPTGNCWLAEYVIIKREYKTIVALYLDSRLSKSAYYDWLKNDWLCDAYDFVERTCCGARELVPVDLRAMIQYSRLILGCRKEAWPPVLFVTDNGDGALVHPVDVGFLGV